MLALLLARPAIAVSTTSTTAQHCLYPSPLQTRRHCPFFAMQAMKHELRRYKNMAENGERQASEAITQRDVAIRDRDEAVRERDDLKKELEWLRAGVDSN